MNKIHLHHQKTFFIFCITLTIFCLINLISPSVTHPSLATDNSELQVRFVQPLMAKEPADRGSPDRRESAGTRGDTCFIEPPFTALVPPLNEKKYVWGLTTQAYPTFWLYLPYQPNSSLQVEFQLRDESQKSILTDKKALTIPLSGTPGIVSFRLPEKQQPLEVGKPYKWSFRINCSSEEIVVRGWIQRIESSQNQPEISPRNRTIYYAANGIWFDALTELAQLRRKAPNDPNLRNDWVELLKSVELEQLASAPLVSCCNSD